ncbi:response regulator transcription factor [Micromonospora chersina]|uniref:response regulator transcription factor n=1 Tax=Micromonospora chersina TaxID=47854 RepID=UPI0037128277
MTMPAVRMPTPRDSSTGDLPPKPHPTRTPETDTALLRQHVVAALRAMLDQVLVRAIDTTTTESGVSVMLEHDNVRCVLVICPRVPRHPLSPRELQIARKVADGATNRAIASSLDISLWTVSTHMRRIFAKLGVSSRAEMVAQFFGGGDSGQLR